MCRLGLVRLDHYISKELQISERQARLRVASGKVMINGVDSFDQRFNVTRFDEVRYSSTILQPSLERLYIKLHKAVGVVSATKDDKHQTVLDFITHPDKHTLHLAGRLDRSSSGLVLLSNDSTWSESLTHPDQKVDKVYVVETDRPIPEVAVENFANGIEFTSEGITTRPAKLEILDLTRARITLQEGRWHQIKRMFYHLDGIRLTSLHRESIGPYDLDDLPVDQWSTVEATPSSK